MYSLKSPFKLVCPLLRAVTSPVLYGVFEDSGADGGGDDLVEEGVACR